MTSIEPGGTTRLLAAGEPTATEVDTKGDHRSIGEVLALLQDEFVDISISKIRFLEAQGLIEPERTPSGYRRFYDRDILRLRWVLRQQRENFLPLKVIKERLEALSDEGVEKELEASPRPPQVVLPEPTLFATRATDIVDNPVPRVEPAARPARAAHKATKKKPKRAELAPTFANVTARELTTMLQVGPPFIADLERYGLISGTVVGNDTHFDNEAVEIARLAADLAAHGIDVRHLRMYKLAVEREIGTFEQVLVPLLRDRDPERNRQVAAILDELIDTGDALRRLLMTQASRPFH